jgi:hypothetical protein
MTQTTNITEDYVAAWNEGDSALRRSAVQRLYSPDCRLVTASVDLHGIQQVTAHIDEVVHSYIGWDKHRFRQAGGAVHHDCVLLRWEMISAQTGRVADWGVNTLLLDGDGRIAADFQFVAPTWRS